MAAHDLERFFLHAKPPRGRPLRLPPRPAPVSPPIEVGGDLPDEAAFDVAIELATRADTDAESMRTLVRTLGKYGTEADIWAMLMDVRGLHGLRLRVLADLEAVETAAILAARPYAPTDEAGRAEAAWMAARPMVADLRRKYKAYASRNVGAWLARICGDRFDYTRRALEAEAVT
jgi:hypothetical protein